MATLSPFRFRLELSSSPLDESDDFWAHFRAGKRAGDLEPRMKFFRDIDRKPF
jgi:hypothetical protein